jgi:homoserine acetyltransferase
MWGSMYPSMVKRIAPFCGSARTSVHNFVFLEGPKNALMTDAEFKGGWYASLTNVNSLVLMEHRSGCLAPIAYLPIFLAL